MAGYYDVILGLIPLSLVGLMCHAMFVNAPAAGAAGTDGPVADPAAAGDDSAAD